MILARGFWRMPGQDSTLLSLLMDRLVLESLGQLLAMVQTKVTGQSDFLGEMEVFGMKGYSTIVFCKF